MKTLCLNALLCCALFSLIYVNASDGAAEQLEPQALYAQWHNVLDAYPALSEPLWFATEGVPEDLATVVREIKQNRIGMAMFLCGKIASETTVDARLYQDVWLLNGVAGINLLYADHPSD